MASVLLNWLLRAVAKYRWHESTFCIVFPFGSRMPEHTTKAVFNMMIRPLLLFELELLRKYPKPILFSASFPLNHMISCSKAVKNLQIFRCSCFFFVNYKTNTPVLRHIVLCLILDYNMAS